MPFFVVELEYRQNSDGTLREELAVDRTAYPTKAEAEAAAMARAALRQRRREAWMLAYEQPFPGDGYRVVEALTFLSAEFGPRDFSQDSPSAAVRQALMEQAEALRLLHFVGTDDVEAMPAEVRSAFERWRHWLHPPSVSAGAPVDELAASYRWQRQYALQMAELKVCIELCVRWLRDHQVQQAPEGRSAP